MEKIDPEIERYIKPIDAILLEISKSSKNLDLTEFSKLVAQYNRELNSLLSIYHQNQEIQKKLKPFIMFYRQLFHELTALVLSESIDDQQLEKIIDIITQKPLLIKNILSLPRKYTFTYTQ